MLEAATLQVKQALIVSKEPRRITSKCYPSHPSSRAMQTLVNHTGKGGGMGI